MKIIYIVIREKYDGDQTSRSVVSCHSSPIAARSRADYERIEYEMRKSASARPIDEEDFEIEEHPLGE